MIGIDLGTTNSLIAVMRDGTPETLKNELGEDLIPSAVAYAEDGALLVGRSAKDRLVTAPDSGKAFFKRDMGTDVRYRFGGKSWSPIQCSAAVLRELKRIAEYQLKEPVNAAVITVPAYFHDSQRLATVEAAKLAGLKVERLLNEPTAAALAYGHRAGDELSTLLIFDLGGGTFDVTVLECFEGVVEVKASAGESRLGGEDYTDQLMEWLMKQHQWKPDTEQRLRWREQVESVKRQLTRQNTARLMLGDREVSVHREEFRLATDPLTARLRPVVLRAMRDAKLTPKHLDGVLMVGGASRMPMVIEQLAEDLHTTPDQSLDPDRVVALGAAVQAALCSGDAAVRDLVLTDVCPHTLGVEVSKQLLPGRVEPGYFSPIIDRNTTVPISRSDRYNTLHPQQDEILLKVYQGESRMVTDNHLIGEVRIRGLRQRPGQKQPGAVDVRFTYDMNGILEVEVTVLSDGRKITEIFQQRPGMLTQPEIDETLRRLQPLKTHPRETPVNRARLERAQRLYTDLLGQDRQMLTHLVDRFEAALATQETKAIDESGADLDRFMAMWFKDEEEGDV